jgi:hypothetical protein
MEMIMLFYITCNAYLEEDDEDENEYKCLVAARTRAEALDLYKAWLREDVTSDMQTRYEGDEFEPHHQERIEELLEEVYIVVHLVPTIPNKVGVLPFWGPKSHAVWLDPKAMDEMDVLVKAREIGAIHHDDDSISGAP